MDNATDIAARTQRFNEAARAFTLPSPSRHAKLAPFADGIVLKHWQSGFYKQLETAADLLLTPATAATK